jgi:hypothetical protein
MAVLPLLRAHSRAPAHLAALACGTLASALGGCKSVDTEILIAAPPTTVWAVLSDAARYEMWNPVHVRIEGVFREGAEVKIHLKEPSGKITVFDATVRRMVEREILNQGGGTPGIFTFNHTFRLEPIEGGTRVTQREEFRGVGVIFFGTDWVKTSYQQVNEALKRRAESLGTAPPGH